jgi:hypothetical protein
MTEHPAFDYAQPDLRALADLLVVFESNADEGVMWDHSWATPFGEVTLVLEVVPAKISEVERDKILSFAARMTNGLAQHG